MKRFVEGEDRRQSLLLPETLDDYVTEDNPVRVVEVFIEELDLGALGFEGVHPAATGRPAYHPSTLLKIYLYGYLNRIQSSRRLEREAQRNIELMWLTGRLAPDFKTIANFRRDNGPAIRAVCGQFIELCRRLHLFTKAIVAIDGSKFKAVNNRDKNFTLTKVAKRMEQVDACIPKTVWTSEGGFFSRHDFTYDAEKDHYICPAGQTLTKGLVRSDRKDDIDHYRHLTAGFTCALKPKCTPDKLKRLKRWRHEGVLDKMQARLERRPDAMLIRRQTVEHPFGTLKSWMGSAHFLTKTLEKVRTEMSLHVLAYNMKRMIRIFGVGPLLEAMRA